MSNDYLIPYDAAEIIAVTVLKYHKKIIEDELEKYYGGTRKMVEADVTNYHKLSKNISTVIDYFGT